MSSGTYSQIYIQVVFAVSGRRSLIAPDWENNLYKYISGIVRNKEQKMLAINGMPDHIHLFIGMRPSCRLSDLVREIKKSSNDYINRNSFSKNRFKWQEGFGAFSYNHKQLDRIVNYVLDQKEHHRNKSFLEEYRELLEEFNVTYDPKYLFEPVE